MPDTTAEQAKSRTVNMGKNPYHEGLTQVRRDSGGVAQSKRICLGRAKNGSPHHHTVAVDWRMQRLEKALRKEENEKAKFYRILECQLAAHFRRIDEEDS
jgi:hypothetical protein